MSIYRTPSSAAQLATRYRTLLAQWPAPSNQRTLSTSDGETFVISSGPTDAPPLVLLHGSAANSASWLGVAAEWSRHFRLHAIDILGEPGLSAPTRLPVISGGHTRWLEEVLTALEIPRAAFAATSLGARLALDHAIHHPTRVDRLALLCPSGIGRRTFGWLPKALLYSLQGDPGRRKLLRLATGATLPPEAEDYHLFLNRHFRPRQGKLTTATDEELTTLTMPILVAVGARDVLLNSTETHHRLSTLVPQARVYLLPNTGHHIPLNQIPILDFLRTPHPTPA